MRALIVPTLLAAALLPIAPTPSRAPAANVRPATTRAAAAATRPADIDEHVRQLIRQSTLRSQPNEPAIRQLGAYGPVAADAVPTLVEILRTGRGSKEAEAAALALPEIAGDPELAVPALIEALKHDLYGTRTAAALRDFGPHAKHAVPALRSLLDAPLTEWRVKALAAVTEIGPPVADLLPTLKRLATEDVRVERWHAVVGRAIISVEQPRVPEWSYAALRKARLEDRLKRLADHHATGEEALEIGCMGPDAAAAVPVLLDLLQRKQDHPPPLGYKAAIAFALGRIGRDPERVVPALGAMFTSADRRSHSDAARAIARFGDRASLAAPGLQDALADRRYEVRWSAAEAIATIGEPVRPTFDALRRAAADPNAYVRVAALKALAQVDPGGARPLLLDALSDPEQHVRINIVLTADASTGGRMKDRALRGRPAAPEVQKVRDDLRRAREPGADAATVCRTAAELPAFDPLVAEALRSILGDQDPELWKPAAAALKAQFSK